jgi:hypothetical protein
MNSVPWYGWAPATMHFCEALTGGPMAQPCNAVSSLAFVAVGLYLFRLCSGRSLYRLFPVSCVLVGVSSFLYHASWTFFFQVFDVSSMYMMSCLLLSFNAWRLGLLSSRRLPEAYAVLVAASIVVMVMLKGRSGETLFGIEIAAAAAMEALLLKRGSGARYGHFVRGLAVFLAALAVWVLDVKEIVCAPENHYLQGHALWHVLNALCFYFMYRFYRQFSPDEALRSRP